MPHIPHLPHMPHLPHRNHPPPSTAPGRGACVAPPPLDGGGATRTPVTTRRQRGLWATGPVYATRRAANSSHTSRGKRAQHLYRDGPVRPAGPQPRLAWVEPAHRHPAELARRPGDLGLRVRRPEPPHLLAVRRAHLAPHRDRQIGRAHV